MAKVLIIGGGVSGLSAGIFSRLAGYETVIIEKHRVAGGNLTGWDRSGCHIDNCIHWLTGTNEHSVHYKTWEQLGALGDGIEIIQGESLYTCELDGQTLTLWRDLDRFERDLLELSPADKKEIKSLVHGVELMRLINGVGGANKDRAITLSDVTRGAPTLLKFYGLTVSELAQRFTHPLIRFFLTSLIGDDFGALALLMVYATFTGDNGGIPRGGSSAMAENMKQRFLSLGGELILGVGVEKINCSGGRARSLTLSDGRELEGDYVVVTTDPALVFGKMLDLPMPKKLSGRYSDSRFYRFSAYHTAFAVDLPELPFSADVIFPIPLKYRGKLRTKALTVREFSHEPEFSPEGKNVIQTMTYCDEQYATELIALKQSDPQAYKEKKNEIARIVEKILIEHYPTLSGKLSLVDVWTPATYKRFVNSDMGSFMSFMMPKKFLPARLGGRVRGASNLILANQWQQPPGGLPIAADGGRAAINQIVKAEKKRKRCEKC